MVAEAVTAGAGENRSPEQRLAAFFSAHPRLAIAFSGGLDSRFLCFAALRAGADVLALHARGPHIPAYETEEAAAFAEDLHLPLAVFSVDPLLLPDAAHNTKRRCYACKKNLIVRMKALLQERGRTDFTLCDGTNHSDLAVFRPGLAALQEEGPWPCAGTKNRSSGPMPRKQACACPLSRPGPACSPAFPTA